MAHQHDDRQYDKRYAERNEQIHAAHFRIAPMLVNLGERIGNAGNAQHRDQAEIAAIMPALPAAVHKYDGGNRNQKADHLKRIWPFAKHRDR